VDGIALHTLLLMSVSVLKDHHFFYRMMHHMNAGARLSLSIDDKAFAIPCSAARQMLLPQF
jgi:hypothetical protein